MHDLPALSRSRIGAGIITAVPITLLAVWVEIDLAGTRLAERDVGVNASANSFGLVFVAFPCCAWSTYSSSAARSPGY